MAPVCSSASPVTGCPGRTYTEEAAGVGTRRRPRGGLGSCNPGGLSPSLWASFRAGTGRDQPGSRAAGGPRRPRRAALSSTATRQRARAARFSLGPGRGSVRVAPWGLSCTPLGAASPAPPAHRSGGLGGVWRGLDSGRQRPQWLPQNTTVLEARNPRWRCQQGRSLLDLIGGLCPRPLARPRRQQAAPGAPGFCLPPTRCPVSALAWCFPPCGSALTPATSS